MKPLVAMIAQDDDSTQALNWANIIGENATSNITNNLAPFHGSRVDIQAIARSIADRMRIEVGSSVKTVEIRERDTTLAAMDILVIPRMTLAMRKVNASCGRDSRKDVLDPDQQDFSGKVEGLQMITSSKLNSNTGWSTIDETRGNVTV